MSIHKIVLLSYSLTLFHRSRISADSSYNSPRSCSPSASQSENNAAKSNPRQRRHTVDLPSSIPLLRLVSSRRRLSKVGLSHYQTSSAPVGTSSPILTTSKSQDSSLNQKRSRKKKRKKEKRWSKRTDSPMRLYDTGTFSRSSGHNKSAKTRQCVASITSLASLAARVTLEKKKKALLIILDNCHLFDDNSWEVVGRLLLLKGIIVCVIMRPQLTLMSALKELKVFMPFYSLNLEPLVYRDTITLICKLLKIQGHQRRELRPIFDGIFNLSGSNPLFIKYICYKLVKDRILSLDVKTGKYQINADFAACDVSSFMPRVMEDLLILTMDNLTPLQQDIVKVLAAAERAITCKQIALGLGIGSNIDEKNVLETIQTNCEQLYSLQILGVQFKNRHAIHRRNGSESLFEDKTLKIHATLPGRLKADSSSLRSPPPLAITRLLSNLKTVKIHLNKSKPKATSVSSSDSKLHNLEVVEKGNLQSSDRQKKKLFVHQMKRDDGTMEILKSSPNLVSSVSERSVRKNSKNKRSQKKERRTETPVSRRKILSRGNEGKRSKSAVRKHTRTKLGPSSGKAPTRRQSLNPSDLNKKTNHVDGKPRRGSMPSLGIHKTKKQASIRYRSKNNNKKKTNSASGRDVHKSTKKNPKMTSRSSFERERKALEDERKAIEKEKEELANEKKALLQEWKLLKQAKSMASLESKTSSQCSLSPSTTAESVRERDMSSGSDKSKLDAESLSSASVSQTGDVQHSAYSSSTMVSTGPENVEVSSKSGAKYIVEASGEKRRIIPASEDLLSGTFVHASRSKKAREEKIKVRNSMLRLNDKMTSGKKKSSSVSSSRSKKEKKNRMAHSMWQR